MPDIELHEFSHDELTRGEQLILDGRVVTIRNANITKGRLSLGRSDFAVSDIQDLLKLCLSFNELTDSEALYMHVMQKSYERQQAEKDLAYKSLWQAVAKDAIRAHREGATPFTDSVLNVSLPKVTDRLEEFSIKGTFDESIFSEEFLPIFVDGKVIFPKAECPATGMIRIWHGAYSGARTIFGLTHPKLLV